MSWALWLAVPVAVTVLAALWSWVRSRPRRLPDTAESMRAHTAYLDALGGATTRGRTPSAPASTEMAAPGADEPD